MWPAVVCRLKVSYMSECIGSRAQLNSFCWHDMFQVNYSRIFIWTFHNIFCFPSLGCCRKAGHKGYIIRNVYAVHVHWIYGTMCTGYMPIWSLQFNIVIATSSLSYFNYVLFISERLLMHNSHTHTPSTTHRHSVATRQWWPTFVRWEYTHIAVQCRRKKPFVESQIKLQLRFCARRALITTETPSGATRLNGLSHSRR